MEQAVGLRRTVALDRPALNLVTWDDSVTTRMRDVDRYEEALAKQLAALLVAEFRRRERRSDEDQAAPRRDEAADIVAVRDQGVAPSDRVFADRIP